MPNFLAQFRDLLLRFPRYNLKIVNSENCDYADTSLNSKNCYYTFGNFHSEELLYSRYSRNCKNCGDMCFSFDCEWCYQCLGCAKCYNVNYCKYCSNCSDCSFSENLIGCKNCFGCIGLVHKEYYFFNEKLSPEDYCSRLSQCDLKDHRHIEAVGKKLDQLRLKTPQLCVHQTMCEDCVGDNLVQCKNAYQCFDAYDLEDCNYCIETNSLKDCTDMTVNFKTEFSYQCIHSPGCTNVNFCYHCDFCSDSEFCAYSRNLKNCFGCSYLKDKEYHILNKPYEKEAYFKAVQSIKADLQARGMYNLFPYFISNYEQQRLKTETDPVIIN